MTIPDPEPAQAAATSTADAPAAPIGPAPPKGQMLPGIAGICLFLLFTTGLNVFAALRGAYGNGTPRYAVLAICTLLAAGIFGLLRMQRWGWALVQGGCLTMCLGDLFFFEHTHAGFFLVRSLFTLVFFLYLTRTEVRERLR